MTTVAWDGTTLAGDTQGVINGYTLARTQKIFRLANGALFGGSGRYEDILEARDWLDHPEGPKPAIAADDGFSCLLVTPEGGVFRLESRLMCSPIYEPYAAVGSGRDFALAAMALGRTAAQAVVLAMQFDVCTGGLVEQLTVESPSALCDTHEAFAAGILP